MSDAYHNVDAAARIERIIRFFKSLKVKKPACENPDDTCREKTESEYQQEQARWLEKVNQKRKRPG